jgi:N-acetyl-anhydromuramoyl-L-alanine amidase
LSNHQNLNVNPLTGLLEPIKYLPSPHHDQRPADMPIDMIVIHGISLPPGEFGSSAVEEFFCGKLDHSAHAYYKTISTLKVSSHLYVKRTGEIIQFVPFFNRAWHAGQSSFKGRNSCNDFSIGIELEGTDEIPYEPGQYHSIICIIRLLMQHYPAITQDRIVGHSDIAPLRKTDPGPYFDWDLVRAKI